jgi:L-asparaginase
MVVSILLLATGGTIASRPGTDGSVTTALSGAEVLATVSGVDLDDVEVVDVASVSSWNVEPDKRAEVAAMCRRALADGRAEAVVITHGTDTVEETAWFTELLAGSATERGPIVFTVAMRNAAALAADGPANLRDAIVTSRSPSSRDRGVMVCANSELHHARWVTKTDAHALDTFRSPAAAPIGRVVGGRVTYTLASPPCTSRVTWR